MEMAFDEQEFERKMQVAEAAGRLQLLEGMGMHHDVLRQWDDEQRVFYSDRMSMFDAQVGALFWLDNMPDWEEKVKNFEEKHGALVYHCTHEHTRFGELLDMFYVSKHMDEWELDFRDMTHRRQVVYCENLDDPAMSEIGSIEFRVGGGGLVRTA